MKKKCPDGKYYCYTDKVCKDIPKGFKMVGPMGMLRKENGHSVDDDSESTKKNGKKNGSVSNGNGNGNGGNGNGSGNGGSSVSEDLRDWFGSGPKGGKGGGGWDRYNSKGERIGKCARGEGEGKPKCLSNEKASKMSKAERAAAVRRKRREDPVADRPGKGGKPIMTSNKIKESSSPMVRQILERLEYEREWKLLAEKNVPTNPSLWSKFKAQAKAKFDVYPSAYANGWAAKKYKAAGGSWKKATKEEVEYLDEKKGCAHNHKGEECPVHGMKECPDEKKIDEAVRVPAKTGNLYQVMFTFKGKLMLMKVFFPEVSPPTRTEVQAALDKVYPGCHLKRFDKTDYQPGELMINVGEEVEDLEELAPLIAAPLAVAGKVAAVAAKGIATGAKSVAKASVPVAKSITKGVGRAAQGGIESTAAGVSRGRLERKSQMEGAEKKEHPIKNYVPDNVKGIAKELDKAVEMHKSQAKRLRKSGVSEGAAWTKKSGKDDDGGLNEKGRKSYERENPGSDLKRPSKKVGNPRRKSFCARMKGMKSKLTSAKTANDPNSRINKSLRAWNC
jgi:hypothetical protein